MTHDEDQDRATREPRTRVLTAGNTREVAQAVAPESRVGYVEQVARLWGAAGRKR